MKKVSIADIAAYAGVSTGTVSNVLNNKGNVRLETLKKVEKAINKLGYVRNNDAYRLSANKSNNIILICDSLNHYLDVFVNDLLGILNQQELRLKIIETKNKKIKDIIRQLTYENYISIVLLDIEGSEAILETIDNDKIISLSDCRAFKHRITLNFDRIFDTYDELEDYVIISDRQGFNFCKKFASEYKERYGKSMTIVRGISDLNQESYYKFVVFSEEDVHRISLMSHLKDDEISFILITSSNSYAIRKHLFRKYYFSANQLALHIDKFIHKEDTNEEAVIDVQSMTPIALKPTFETKELKLLLLGNTFPKALEKIVHIYSQQTQVVVTIHQGHFDEINDLIASGDIEDYDLIRTDLNNFSWFAKDIFLNLKDFPELQTIADTLDMPDSYMYIDEELYALPIDPTIQLMLYRKDVFDDHIIQKMYLDQYETELRPPTTYKELVQFSEFYASLSDSEKPVPYPLTTMNNHRLIVASEFLPYFKSLGGEINYSGESIFISPLEFDKALNLYKELIQHSHSIEGTWWNDEVEAFNHDASALLICYTNYLTLVDGVDYDYQAIPGGIPALGGGTIGINKHSQHTEQACIFLQWLFRYQTQRELANLGVEIPRSEIFYEREIYRKYPFLLYASENFDQGYRLQYTKDGRHIFNTIGIERVIGAEIIRGISKNLTNMEVYVRINEALNRDLSAFLKEI